MNALSDGRVTVHGWVPELAPIYDSVRLSIAPLRYGAGFKGKLAASLARGVPVVATSIAIEGTGLADGDGVMIADEPEAFAHAILRMHDDPGIWWSQSRRGLERCAALYSPEQARATWRDLLRRLDLPFAAG